MAALNVTWLNIPGMFEGDMVSWRNITICKDHFFPDPETENIPNIIGSVKDTALFRQEPPRTQSIEVHGCYELFSGLGVALKDYKAKHGNTDGWANALRSIVATVFVETDRRPKKGLQVMRSRDLKVREQTQILTCYQAAKALFECIEHEVFVG